MLTTFRFGLFSVLLNSFVINVASAQALDPEDIDPAEARSAWLDLVPGVSVAAAPYTLTETERDKFGGTFGIDLSHYSFDTGAQMRTCKTQEGYTDAKCSCVADWDAVVQNGIRYIYSKATDGTRPDLSFSKYWEDLQSMHISKTLFRGAYHFFRPGVDPEKQADAFLAAIGAINGKRPKQLPPALDIEWATRSVEPGSFEFDACPRDRLSHDKAHNRWFCDMWYTVSSEEIADTAQKWIDRVEAATGLPVIIYTNPSWWNSVMQDAGLPLIARQAVWTSRYTSEGPVYKQSWTVQGGSPEWGMAPLPKGARYPRKSYSVAHSWQFTETGHLSDSIFTCSGNLTERAVDLNWLPTNRSDFEYLFKVKD